ncbi:MAG: hypothetical protein VX438_03250 [Planctomycetota bacterium]|jgi:hypothetical protein|nr:hypothetical protein [Planctomycetota bacterium]
MENLFPLGGLPFTLGIQETVSPHLKFWGLIRRGRQIPENLVAERSFAMKKLFTLVLVACFAFSVVGCGGGDANKTQEKKTETKKEEKK